LVNFRYLRNPAVNFGVNAGRSSRLGFTLPDQAHISQQLRFAVQRLAVSLFINAKDCALVRIP
jgi:hypothetical protein